MRTRTPVKRGEMEAITVILCLGGFPNVSKGIADTQKLKQICGGATKRIYLYVKRKRPGNSYKITCIYCQFW